MSREPFTPYAVGELRNKWRQTATRAQRESVLRKFRQNPNGAASYKEFRKRAKWSFGVLMLPWCGMWLGIETDGHTHS